MSMPAPNPKEPSKMKRIMNSKVDESIWARLPRSTGLQPVPTHASPPVMVPEPPVQNRGGRWGSGLLPAFWTIASLISLIVNVILFALLLVAFQMLDEVRPTADEQVSRLLGGLYTNFVKMEEATITRTIPVEADIPLNIVVPVNATTPITLAEPVVIRSRVVINEPNFYLNAPANVTLPAETQLTVRLDFPLTVQNTIPVHLDVPVDIPLRETQLYEPFVGLQQVVQPWYCLLEPNALMADGRQVCSPRPNPTPAGTSIP